MFAVASELVFATANRAPLRTALFSKCSVIIRRAKSKMLISRIMNNGRTIAASTTAAPRRRTRRLLLIVASFPAMAIGQFPTGTVIFVG